MSQSKSAKRRQRRQKQQQLRKAIESEPATATVSVDPEPAKEAEPEAPAAEEASVSFIDQVTSELGPGESFVIVSCGENEVRETYPTGQVADVAEAAAKVLVSAMIEQGAFPPADAIMATVFTHSALYGPFPISLDLTLEAKF